MRPITAWAVTTGEAGMRAQARGLAERVGAPVTELVFDAGAAGRLLPRRWRARSLERLATPAGALPPAAFPDLLVTCGRRAVAVSLAMKQASPATVRAHIQDPRRPPADFDLVVALAHDDLAAGGNVFVTLTALHDATPGRLAAAAAAWRARFAALPRPLTGVAIGGPTRRSGFSGRDGARLLAALREVRAAGGGLAITPSRRTPSAVVARLAAAFAGDPGAFFWDGAGGNPYLAILALSDALIVSGDSVSMVSEAIAAGAPLQVFDTGQGRHQRFLDNLLARGLASRHPDPPPSRAGGYDATDEAAAALRRLVSARQG